MLSGVHVQCRVTKLVSEQILEKYMHNYPTEHTHLKTYSITHQGLIRQGRPDQHVCASRFQVGITDDFIFLAASLIFHIFIIIDKTHQKSQIHSKMILLTSIVCIAKALYSLFFSGKELHCCPKTIKHINQYTKSADENNNYIIYSSFTNSCFRIKKKKLNKNLFKI